MFPNFRKWLSKSQNAVVLLYHRVNTVPDADPWDLFVTRDAFREQLTILKNNYNVVSLQELIQMREHHAIKPQTVCISFDDGYLDNYTNAVPLLQEFQLPACFFIVSGKLNPSAYWWDRLADLTIFNEHLPNSVKISVAGKNLAFFNLPNKYFPSELLRSWRWPNNPPDERSRLFFDLWSSLKLLREGDIQRVIDELEMMVGAVNNGFDNKLMTPLNIRELLESRLFSIGIHTDTHPALGVHPIEFQLKELESCQQILNQFKSAGNVLDVVAYPYGHYDNFTLNAMRELVLKNGFTTRPTAIQPGTPLLEMGRFVVKNWSGKEFQNQLESMFASI